MWGRIIANSEKLRVKCKQTRLKMGGFCGGRSLRSGRNGGRDWEFGEGHVEVEVEEMGRADGGGGAARSLEPRVSHVGDVHA